MADVSGNGNNGTITGATWSTQGRYGGALSVQRFDQPCAGAGSASLGLSSAMTLMAWIKPTASQSGWRTIMQRQTDAYFLNASNDAGPLRPGGRRHVRRRLPWVSGPDGEPGQRLDACGADLRRRHAAAVRQRHAGGDQRRHPARSRAATNPLWIGGNSPYGEYFQGLIDEVRVYNRALTPAEIQADMNTRWCRPTPDTTAADDAGRARPRRRPARPRST